MNDVDMLWLLTKIDASGNTIWTRAVVDDCALDGATTGSVVLTLAATPDDETIYAMGSCLSRLDGSGNLLWSRALPPYDTTVFGMAHSLVPQRYELRVSDDGEASYLLAPTEAGTSLSSTLTRFAADGAVVWQTVLDRHARNLGLHQSSGRLMLMGDGSNSGGQRMMRVSVEDGTIERTVQ